MSCVQAGSDHDLKNNSKQTPEPNNTPLAGEGLVCVCCVRVWTHSGEWAAAVRTCVRRLATVFTVSNDFMSLVEGLSEAASFHCVSQPVWEFGDKV